MRHLKEWQDCDRIWRDLGRPIPCHDPKYLAAREKLQERLQREYLNHSKARGG